MNWNDINEVKPKEDMDLLMVDFNRYPKPVYWIGYVKEFWLEVSYIEYERGVEVSPTHWIEIPKHPKQQNQ